MVAVRRRFLPDPALADEYEVQFHAFVTLCQQTKGILKSRDRFFATKPTVRGARGRRPSLASRPDRESCLVCAVSQKGDETTLQSPDQGSARPWPGGVFSCVVDTDPRFHREALRWYASLTRVAGVEPTDLVVHSVGTAQSEILDFLKAQGVRVTTIEPFDSRSPHCNKIAGALRLAAMGVDGLAILSDADVVVLEDPRTLSFPSTSVASKLVDNEHPPLRILTSVFEKAGVGLPALVPLEWYPSKSTIAGNGNGGLYLVPGGILGDVARAWDHWARWLLERRDLLARATLYLDQIAMALALASEGIGAHALDSRWNFPSHRRQKMPSDPPIPAVIHYHENVSPAGLLIRTGFGAVDKRIDMANAAITETWRDVFPNATFWEWRSTNSDRGSGSDSQGATLEETRNLLLALVDILQPKSILDVGCGDGEATEGLPFANYVGLDVSPEAIQRARDGRPEGDYRVGGLADHSVHADLTLCLDALIHQANESSYAELVGRLVQATTRGLLVSGYEQAPNTDPSIVHFYEPLSSTLARLAPDAEQYPLREVHGITTILLLKPPEERHPRDYKPETLSKIARQHPNLLRLIRVRTSAWETVGFFPDHAPRLWEYPMVAEYIMTLLHPGSPIVDIGAGVNPLVPYLTQRGYVVDTVDPADLKRVWPSRADWNEWGYLDYAQQGFAHQSWNCTMGELPLEAQFDGTYCLGVIEHLPAAERRSLLGDIARNCQARWDRPSHPRSRRREGRLVESSGRAHGGGARKARHLAGLRLGTAAIGFRHSRYPNRA